jgi:diguanylate cyclase (GGDEF)-like protein
MKNIAVLIHSLTVEYAVQILNGISSYCSDKDVRVMIFQLNDPFATYGVFDYQNWSAIEYLKSDEIDGVIIIYGSFSMTVSAEYFRKVFEKINKPVVSVSMELGLKNEITTYVDCDQVYDDIVKHFIQKHHCKKIAFLSANATISKEAIQRFEAYKKALKSNNFEFDENLVFDGYFTQETGYQAIADKIKSKEDLNFDALIVANDNMAAGALNALQEAGIDVPNDVKMIGFDNTSHSYMSRPKISTIDQNIVYQGEVAAQALLKKLNGEDVPSSIPISLSVIYRQSCGCVEMTDLRQIYKNQNDEVVKDEVSEVKGIQGDERFYKLIPKIDSVYALFDMIKSTNSMQELFYIMKYCLNDSDISKALIYFYSQPKILSKGDKFSIPSKVYLSMFIDNDKDIQQFSPEIFINPNKQLFPSDYLKNEPGTYILQPIYSGEKNYGFMICKLTSDYFSIYPLYLKILITGSAYSYEYTQLILNNSSLSVQSKTDELTKVLNRRGFIELGQKSIDLALEMKNTGIIFFIDMDGLKAINDTYGHKMGDEAIKAQALVLKKALRMNDVVGRIGGDEFVAVAIGMTSDSLPKIRKKIEKQSASISAEKNFPFTLSCSIGAIPFTSDKKNLSELLLGADALLYEEKRQKHKQNKSTN